MSKKEVSQDATTGTAEPNASAALPTPTTNREHLESLQKQNDEALTAKQKALANETPEEKKKRLDAKARERKAAAEASKQAAKTPAEKEAEAKRNQELEDAAAQTVTEPSCKACLDKGTNSKGAPCPICKPEARAPKPEKPAEADPFAENTEEAPDEVLVKLEALYDNCAGLSVKELKERCRTAWGLIDDDEQPAVLRGLQCSELKEVSSFNEIRLRKFLEECVQVRRSRK